MQDKIIARVTESLSRAEHCSVNKLKHEGLETRLQLELELEAHKVLPRDHWLTELTLNGLSFVWADV